MGPLFVPDDEALPAVRDALPAVGAGIYLDTGSAGPLPAEAAAAMAEIAEWELRTGRAGPDRDDEVALRLDEARAAVAAVLTADVDEIAITSSGSEALALAVWAVDWQAGDRCGTTTVEHPGLLGPLAALRDRAGVEVVRVAAGPEIDEARLLAALDEALTVGARLVAISHVDGVLGRRLPVGEIAALAHARGALVLVDGSQAAGAIAVDAPALGADAYALSGRKWLLGPGGGGAVWVSRGWRGRSRLVSPGARSFARIAPPGTAEPWPDARRFDQPAPYLPTIVGFARSVGWLSMLVGLEWTHRRGVAQAGAMADRLAAIPGVMVLTPRERMATLVTLRIAGWTAEAALAELGARSFAIAATVAGLDAMRIGIAGFNGAAELERFADTVELLAGHSPATLPPRRTLTILGGDGG